MATRSALALVAFVGVLVSASAWGQPAGKAADQPATKIQTLLVAERADLSQILVDPRDQKLREALAMIPARINELPGEVPGFDPKAAVAITTILATFGRPGRLGITVNAGNPADGMFGYGLVISAFAKDQKDAEALHTQVKSLLEGANLPPAPTGPKRFESMDDVQLPGGMGRLSFGPRKSTEGWRYEVVIGTLDNPDPAWSNLPKPSIEGVTPFARGTFDFAGLTPAATMMATFAGNQNPQLQQMIREMGKSGFYGDKAMKVHFEYGYTPTESRGRVSVEGAGMYKDRLYLSSEPLLPADFAAVPADATMATVSRGDLTFLDALIDSAASNGAPVEQMLAQVKEQTGVDLREDVIRALGGTTAYYLSDSTGGGGIGSLVAMMTYKDRARFIAAQEKLRDFANSMLGQVPNVGKYITLTPWKEEGFDLMSLRFSGLPVPLEITCATTEKWLIGGLTPQAVVAAARQVSGKGDKGLLENPKFASIAKGKPVVGASFVDGPRMMKTGYPIISMLGSAIANGVRSPSSSAVGRGREVGMIVPTFNDLAKEARSSVMLNYWNGDNYVIDSYGDRSVLVSGAAGVGVVMNVLPAFALPAAAIAGIMEQQKQKRMKQQPQQDQMNEDGGDQSMLWWRGLAVPETFGALLRLDPMAVVAYDRMPPAFAQGPALAN